MDPLGDEIFRSVQVAEFGLASVQPLQNIIDGGSFGSSID